MTDKQYTKSNILKNKYYWLRLLLHIPNFFKLMLSLLRDKQVPFYLKVISYTAFLYCLSPYDLIPIFAIPLLGWIDDVIIFYICMKLLVSFSPPGVVEKHVRAIDEEMKRKFSMWR